MMYDVPHHLQATALRYSDRLKASRNFLYILSVSLTSEVVHVVAVATLSQNSAVICNQRVKTILSSYHAHRYEPMYQMTLCAQMQNNLLFH